LIVTFVENRELVLFEWPIEEAVEVMLSRKKSWFVCVIQDKYKSGDLSLA
jgi:hypothetical protein